METLREATNEHGVVWAVFFDNEFVKGFETLDEAEVFASDLHVKDNSFGKIEVYKVVRYI